MTATDASFFLQRLSHERLHEIARGRGISLPSSGNKARKIERLLDAERLERPGTGSVDVATVVGWLRRDELKAACRALDLDDSGRARPRLARRLLEAIGAEPSAAPAPVFGPVGDRRHLPRVGDLVEVRHRHHLVEDVEASSDGTSHRVSLVCLDDDAQGRPLEVLWELELGAQVVQPEARTLGRPEALDPPGRFAAYLATLRWHSVTATDARLFQSPFRAGIRLLNHQLVPLGRALQLPRANLFIADDVGLGKTIEAGLVLQELRLRQRVDLVLVICPAAICLQWRDELASRFGLRFEIMNRDFVTRRKQERGFGVNPWATHSRFIVSYSILRRPEYRDPLIHHLGSRASKSLLILDEAHTAAPSASAVYAVDSQTTRVIRDIAHRFENRLFLSATPHNGHSNSFSALLELLDPQRFTRGVPVAPEQRDEVMVRRLKADLRRLDVGGFPRRHVIRLELEHDADGWTLTTVDPAAPESECIESMRLGEAPDEPFELELAELLHRYGELTDAADRGEDAGTHRGVRKVVLLRLQQRLLSSVHAFDRTLRHHATALARRDERERSRPARQARLALLDGVDDVPHGVDDDDLERAREAEVDAASRGWRGLRADARACLDTMLELSARWRDAPGAKDHALLAWIRRHQCPAVRFGGVAKSETDDATSRRWTGRRLLLFTEFGHTLEHLRRLLDTAFAGTDRGSERLMVFRGGLGDAERDAVQRAFNAPPDEHPVRVLLATDAAREGVNLQGACHDLLHYDLPWNPARLEQRNGRIDRTLQPSPDVYCRYIVYPQRPEDRILDTVVRKVDRIRSEVGSLGTVVLDRIEAVLDDGIDERTLERLEAADAEPARQATVRAELDGARDALEAQIVRAAQTLDRSRELIGFRPELLHRAVDEALALHGLAPLEPVDRAASASGAYRLPPLPDSWQATLDLLRPPREPDEPLWRWREERPRPVVFEPPKLLASDRVHLHLEHPLVERLLSRFRARGAGGLGRVTALLDPDSAVAHVVLVGRLALFGRGARRLHDQLVTVAGPFVDLDDAQPLDPRDERSLVERMWRLLEQPEPTPKSLEPRILGAVPRLVEWLWPYVVEEAETLAHEAEARLAARGAEERDALRELLVAQRRAIEAEVQRQLPLEFETHATARERRQRENEREHMQSRLDRLEHEIETEPSELEDLYRIALRRPPEPVGLVVLWPTSR